MTLLAPRGFVRNGPVLCPFRRITGHSCPSCGMTRSWNAAVNGEIRDAFRFHPLGPPALVAAVLVAVVPTKWLEPLHERSASLSSWFAVAWIGIWLARLLRGGVERN